MPFVGSAVRLKNICLELVKVLGSSHNESTKQHHSVSLQNLKNPRYTHYKEIILNTKMSRVYAALK